MKNKEIKFNIDQKAKELLDQIPIVSSITNTNRAIYLLGLELVFNSIKQGYIPNLTPFRGSSCLKFHYDIIQNGGADKLSKT